MLKRLSFLAWVFISICCLCGAIVFLVLAAIEKDAIKFGLAAFCICGLGASVRTFMLWWGKCNLTERFLAFVVCGAASSIFCYWGALPLINGGDLPIGVIRLFFAALFFVIMLLVKAEGIQKIKQVVYDICRDLPSFFTVSKTK
ncbi:MAG: hypothetical protein OXR68_03260 [Alphaproteobacteria bacterium]|nr:hypothetical protein [Alphaproteobacteria bacterium]MDD9919624.1 hypothetical protein [Alphaproteobacteria bacterium]